MSAKFSVTNPTVCPSGDKHRADDKSCIRISIRNPDYGRLSLLYRSDIFLWGIIFPSAAHLYLAQRYLYADAPPANERMVRMILLTPLPRDAEQLAYKKKMYLKPWQMKINALIDKLDAAVPRPDWLEIQINTLLISLRAKFSQDREAAELLLSTGVNYLCWSKKNSKTASSCLLIRDIYPSSPRTGIVAEQVRCELADDPDSAKLKIPLSPLPVKKITKL